MKSLFSYYLYLLPNTVLRICLRLSQGGEWSYIFDCLIKSKYNYKTNKALGYKVKNRSNSHELSIVCKFSFKDAWGLTDRFKGCVSIYQFCKENGYAFKILHENPFELTDYLMPNQYDWTISSDEFKSINPDRIIEIYMSGSRVAKCNHWDAQQFFLKRLSSNHNLDCIVLHTNAAFGLPNFSDLHKELFKPTEKLRENVDLIKRKLGSYVSVSFRFVSLLGDSEEEVHGFDVLEPRDRQKLMQKCSDALIEIFRNHESVLVTSDSYNFLTYLDCLNIPNIFYIKGDKIHHHMGFTEVNDTDSFMKSFVEFYLISDSDEVYQIKSKEMYHSQFPVKAALLNSRPYKLIEI